jgi:Skp family chaperone for outer membrane proteins
MKNMRFACLVLFIALLQSSSEAAEQIKVFLKRKVPDVC